jgi:hypothetical protein
MMAWFARWLPRDALWLTALFGAILAMLATAPHAGNFWWSDAPRHALNGVFLMDMIRDFPIVDPVGHAKNYYAQYPALSILFYPPLFPLAAAPVYAVFGVSHLSAQLAVSLFWIALVIGSFRLAQRFLPSSHAFAAVLLFMSLHEVSSWGRQVMLEIPVYASMVWAMVMFLRYLDTLRARYLYRTVIFIVCALYTKQTAIFLVPAIGLMMLVDLGKDVLRNKHLWIAFALAVLMLIPLAVMTVKFGQVNVSATVGETGNELSRMDIAAWTYYARQLPSQVGWPTLVLALSYFVARWFRPNWRLSSAERLFILWFACGYIFFSLVALKEPRHSLLILLPLPMLAVAALYRKVPTVPAMITSIGMAIGSFAYAMFADEVPFVDGYGEAASYIADHAPRDSLVLFSGYRDGSFIFNMITHGERRDLGVLRSDKLLLKVKVKRELGVEQRQVGMSEVATMLNRYGVSYVVSQPNFWDDLEVMRMFQELLHTPQFVKVGEVRVTGNVPHADKILEIYRNLEYTPRSKEHPRLDLLIIDQVI